MEKNFNPIVFDIITKTKGDVLDVGFGWGISSKNGISINLLKSMRNL
jgi:hypothetical protein